MWFSRPVSCLSSFALEEPAHFIDMGLCGRGGMSGTIDAALAQKSATCMKKMKSAVQKDDGKCKLLILGAGESGKSTVFKQMRIINAAGYSSAELRQFRWIIHRNIIDGIKVIIEATREQGLEMSDSNEELADSILLYEGENVTPEIGKTYATFRPPSLASMPMTTFFAYLRILAIWSDPAVEQAFARRAEFQLGDSFEYFVNELPRIAAADYQPSTDDALRARVRTSGIVCKDFVINGRHFQMYDVGGQRSERRHWLPLFENVSAIIFVAAISEYNQVNTSAVVAHGTHVRSTMDGRHMLVNAR